MGRGTDSERPSKDADQASDIETAMSNKLAETVACWLGFHDWKDTCPDCLWGWCWMCQRCGAKKSEGVQP